MHGAFFGHWSLCYWIVVVVLEIPSGYFSDHFGRKPTLIIATLFWFLGYLVYALSGTFGGFIVAELLLAVGGSFLSGTTDALAYDSLLELKEEDRYRRVASYESFLHFASEGVMSVLGGLIALVSLRMTFIATLPFLALGFLIALTFKEPKRHRIQETQHLKKIWNVCTHTLIRSAPLRSIILLWAIVSTMSLTLFWLTQPFELMVEVPLVWFGVVHGVIVFAGAIASKCTPFLARWMDDRLLLLLIAGAVAVSYLALGFVTIMYGLAFFFVVRIAWSLLTPLTSDLINRSSIHRARKGVHLEAMAPAKTMTPCTTPNHTSGTSTINSNGCVSQKSVKDIVETMAHRRMMLRSGALRISVCVQTFHIFFRCCVSWIRCLLGSWNVRAIRKPSARKGSVTTNVIRRLTSAMRPPRTLIIPSDAK